MEAKIFFRRLLIFIILYVVVGFLRNLFPVGFKTQGILGLLIWPLASFVTVLYGGPIWILYILIMIGLLIFIIWLSIFLDKKFFSNQ